MKNTFLFILLPLLLLSCSKDDDTIEPPDPYILESIIGSWSYDTVRINGALFQYPHAENCVKDLFQFYNQAGKWFDFEEDIILNCDNCAECAIGSTNLKWDLHGNIVDLYFGENHILKLKILQINDNFLKYIANFDYDGDGNMDEVEITAIPYDPYHEFD